MNIIRSLRPMTRFLVLVFAIAPLLLGAAEIALAQQIGDTDSDNDVDLDDINNVRNNFGGFGRPGDTFPFDGVVDLQDLKAARGHFPAGIPVVGPAPASGAEIHLTPRVVAVNSIRAPFTGANWMANNSGGALIAPGQGSVFATLDLLMTIGNVARPDAVGWGNAVVDFQIDGDIQEGVGGSSIGWLPSDATVDHDANAETPNVVLFADNGDLGSIRDLRNILAGLAPLNLGTPGVDPRFDLGQNEPTLLGRIVVTLDTDVVGTTGNVAALATAFSTFDENLQLGRNDGPATGDSISLSVSDAVCAIGDTRLCDGQVDISDLNQVRNHFGAVGPDNGTLLGDTFPFDGVVNIADLNNVRNQFGASVEMAVPEPAAGGLLLLGLLVIGLLRNRRDAA